ncbi:MAG: transglutaminase protein, partial [Gemmataceae bacterium]|nr:transglutaminase protein [Gemmataceae bacterium]
MAGESPSRGLWVTTFVLAAVALLTLEIGAAPGHKFPWTAVPAVAAPVALAVLAARFLPPPGGRRPPPPWAVVGLVGLAAAPFVTEPVVESLTGSGRPLELQMLTGFGYVSLGLAALGRFAKCLRLAAVGSLFLTLFGLSLGNKPAALWCLAVYAAAGVVWLTAGYRAGLRPGASGPPGVVVTTAAGRAAAGGRVP